MRVAAPPVLKEAGGIHPSILPLGSWLGQVPILAALDRNELGALLVAAGLGPPLEHALISHAQTCVHHRALDAGVPLRDVQIAARHADPRTTTIYDHRRENLDRHAAYAVVAYVTSG